MGQSLKVATQADLPPGKAMAVTVDNRKIAVFNIDGKLYAIDDECTHAGGSLSEGEVKGTVVSCPWHGAQFDVTTGAVLSAPAFDSVKSYKVFSDDNEIKIEIP